MLVNQSISNYSPHTYTSTKKPYEPTVENKLRFFHNNLSRKLLEIEYQQRFAVSELVIDFWCTFSHLGVVFSNSGI